MRADLSSFFVATVPAWYLLLSGIPGPFDWGLVLLTGALVWIVLSQPAKLQELFKLDVWLIVFVGAWLVACIHSVNPGRSFQLSISLLPGVLIYWLTSRSVSTSASRQAFSFAMCCISIILSIQILSARLHYSDPQQVIDKVNNLLLVVPNDALLLVFCALLSIPLFNEKRWCPRILGFLAFVMTSAAVLAVNSRGALLALLIGYGTWLILRRSLIAILLLAALGFAMILTEYMFGSPLLGKFQGLWDNRILLWQSAWSQFLTEPWTGHGPFSFGLLHEVVLSEQPNFQIDQRKMPWPHNLYLELLAGGGVLLGAAFLIVLIQHSLQLKSAFHSAKDWYAMLTAVFAALLVSATYELSFIRLGFIVILFTTLGLTNLTTGSRHSCRIGQSPAYNAD